MPSEELTYGQILSRYVFSNPFIWLVSITNFFVYTIRYSILSWAPTFLSQQRHIQLTHGAAISATFEFAGMFGALTSGYITDRFFGGRAIRVALFYMLACTGLLYLFYSTPDQLRVCGDDPDRLSRLYCLRPAMSDRHRRRQTRGQARRRRIGRIDRTFRLYVDRVIRRRPGIPRRPLRLVVGILRIDPDRDRRGSPFRRLLDSAPAVGNKPATA